MLSRHLLKAGCSGDVQLAPDMGSPDFLWAESTGAQLPGSDVMQETDPRTYKWFLFQPLHCLHPFGHLSVFLLHPFPACKRGFAPLGSAEVRWQGSKQSLKVAALENHKEKATTFSNKTPGNFKGRLKTLPVSGLQHLAQELDKWNSARAIARKLEKGEIR